MPEPHRVAVLGGGSFGTVLANIAAANGHDVVLWMRSGERAGIINASQENPDYLPGYVLRPELLAATELRESVDGADLVMVAVPSRSCREVARELAKSIDPQALVVSTTKGLEPGGFKLMSEVLAEELPGNPIGVFSGPNLAKEIAAGQLTGSVIASDDERLNQVVHDLFHSRNMRVFSSHDRYGVELGGALKNVYAIMAGLAAALQLGQNTVGLLLTRSLAEMSRFAVQLGADPLTFLGLAGVGDLFVTCNSPLSRNYRVGFALGRGQALDAILDELGQVAEGINSLRLLKEEADRRGVEMPLAAGLYAMIYERKGAQEVLAGLMHSEQSRDVEFVVRESSQ
jgi:glycerol-3-phosphate dehydrogenase (NAD(P)+)